MLPTDREYEIYFAGEAREHQERPLARRQSWPKGATVASASAPTHFSPRRVIGRALIALGQLIAAEPRAQRSLG